MRNQAVNKLKHCGKRNLRNFTAVRGNLKAYDIKKILNIKKSKEIELNKIILKNVNVSCQNAQSIY